MKFLKGIAYSFVLLLFLVNPTTASANNSFADVQPSDESFKEINYITERGIISGYTENGKKLYKPQNNITRAQASKMLIIATNNENHNGSHVKLKDVEPGSEQEHYIQKAVSLGIFKSDANGTFKPNEFVQRKELAAAVATAFKLTEPVSVAKPLHFTDIKKTDLNAAHINALYYAGVSRGDNGAFGQEKLLTRKQFALFVARAMDKQFQLKVSNPQLPTIAKGKAKVNDLNIRTGRSAYSGYIVGKLNAGDSFEVIGNYTDWVEIRYHNRPAYISKSSKYVEFLDADSKPIGAAQYFVKVKTGSDTLNVRTQPSANAVSTVIGKLNNNDIVEVHAEKNGWLLINFDGIPGYVNASYTEKVDTSSPGGDTGTGKLVGKVTVNGLNVRASASDASASIGKLNRGQKVDVIGLNGFWATINFNGKTAYVAKSYLKLLNQSSTPLKDRIIVIDAGHGGSDGGAAGNGILEKNLTLDVAKRVETKLKNAGANVLMTRTGDTFPTLKDRTDYAKKHYAETFVSIHGNSFSKPSANGAEVFYDSSGNPNGDESRLLAQYIQNNIVKMANMTDRGVKNTGFYVLKNNQVASVLVELGFMTNKEDAEKLKKNPDLFAEAIYQGLLQYYSAQ